MLLKSITMISIATTMTFAASVQAAELTCTVSLRTAVFELKGDGKDAQQLVGQLGAKAAAMKGSEPESVLDAAFGQGGYEVQARDRIEFVPDGSQQVHGSLDEKSKAVTSSGKTSVMRYRDGWQMIYDAKVSIDHAILANVVVQQYDQTPFGSKPSGGSVTGALQPGQFLTSQWGSNARFGFLTQMVDNGCK